MKEKILRINLYLGLFVLIFSTLLLIFRVSFMKTWFFPFAWWSFILIVDSLNFRRMKSSPISQSLKNFLFAAFISVFIWLVFELFNLRARNWSYYNLPPCLVERWLGFFIAFSSVVPALKEISMYTESFLKKRKFSLFRIKATPAFLIVCVFLGVLSIFLSLGWPQLFFPLVWLCFIFLLEPLNFWLNNETFLSDLERKNWTRLWSWIFSGLVAGFLWELWNFWAGSHWKYSLPYLNFWRVFQMPVFGYTGFLPFALQIFAFYQFLSWIHRKLKRRNLIKVLILILLLFFYASSFYLIDKITLIR